MGSLCSSTEALPTVDAEINNNRCLNTKRCRSSCCSGDSFLCCVTVQKEVLDQIQSKHPDTPRPKVVDTVETKTI